MNLRLHTSLAAVILCAASSAAFGQSAEFSVSGGPDNISGKDLGSGYSLENGWQLAFRLTLNTGNHFGHEIGYAYNRTHLLLAGQDTGGMAVHQGFYDFLFYPTKEGSVFRPYIGAGPHFANYVPPGVSVTQGGVQGGNKFGANYGGGLKFFLKSKWMARIDFRQYVNGKPFDLGGSGSLRQNVLTVGFGIGL